MKAVVFVILLLGAGGYFFWSQQKANEPLVEPAPVVREAPKPAAKPASAENTSVESLLAQGRYREALKKLDSLAPDLRPASWAMSHIQALEGVGERSQALAELQVLLKRASHGERATLLKLQANMLLDMGEKDKAGEVFYELFSSYPSSSESEDAMYKLKDLWKPWLDSRDRDQELLKYSKVLSQLLKKAIDESILEDTYALLNRLNARLFFGPKAIEGLVAFHTVAYGENLSSIAKRYGVAPARIAQVNGLKSRNAIRANQHLRIILGRVSVVVDKNRFNMDVYLDGLFFKRYGVGLGRGGNTPSVVTTISRSMARNPSYTVPDTGELIGSEDQRNPIGTRWIGLDIGRGFGIHGTREPNSIGKESSNGCIRMLNENVEELYDYVMVGDEVEIR